MINKRAKKGRRLAIPYTRRLRLEPLEDRRLLANVTVSNLFDVVNGDVSSIAALVATNGGDGISLREAIQAANTDATADTITFSVTGTIGLTLGQLTIEKNLTITGPSAWMLTIDQNTAGSRVFNIDDGNSTNDKTVSISGLTLTGGQVSGAEDRGGAIRSRENLTLTACTISGNETANSIGGGIWQYGGSLVISASTISGNTARFGGGLVVLSGNATIEGSTMSGNSATAQSGGGISLGSSSLIVTNSTISGNTANDYGGGIYLINSNLIVRHSTITGNRSDSDNSGLDLGGGIAVTTYSGATLDHTIVAGNFRGTGATRDDVFVDHNVGPVLASYSLIGDNSFTSLVEAPVGSPDANGNLIGGPVNGAIDPRLGPLANYGGPTLTHALLAGSPAIDAGDPAFMSPPTTDQRGAPFVRVFDGDATGGAQIDIGAYERQAVAGLNLVVDTLADESDGNYSAGNLALREAIILANSNVGPDTITFAAALSGQTILLGGAELVLTEAVTIDATALADNVTIDAQQNSRIFNITATTGDFTLGGLTLTGGRTSFAGGAIFSRTSGTLSLSQSTVSGNSTGDSGVFGVGGGGGIFAYGAVTLTQSTVSGNSTAGYFAAGGGISAGGDVTLTESTVSENSNAGHGSNGGGIRAYGAVTLTQSTVSGNSTGGIGNIGGGGGIFAFGAVTLTQSTVSGNSTAGLSGGGIYARGAVTLTESTVSGNSTARDHDFGGGIFAGGAVTLTQSTVSGNSTAGYASYGGGIAAYGAVTLTQSTVSGNSTAGFNSYGGGIFARGAVTLAQSTVSGNSTAGYGADGGGISAFGAVTLTQSTVSGNSVLGFPSFSLGGGVFQFNTPSNHSFSISGSIVAGNTTGGASDLTSDPDSVLTVKYSLIGTHIAAGIGNITGLPHLGPLANNGGPTQTHALLAGSPAIDTGDPAAVVGMGGTVVSQNLGATAYTASQSLPGAEPEFAFDGFVADGWYAGSHPNPVQWLEVDLQQPQVLTSFRLYVDQFTAGNTIHEIWVSSSAIQNDLSAATLIHTFAGFTSDLDVLRYTLPGLPSTVVARFVQIRTTQSPSWVAWDEVKVLAGPVPLHDQRGVPFTRVYDGDGDGGARIDMGAVERQPIPPAVFGDYNQNGVDDAADYVVWRKFLGTSVAPPFASADGDGDSSIGPGDYGVWRGNFGETLPPGAGSVASEASSVEIQELRADASAARNIAADYIGESVVQIPMETISAPAKTDAVAARSASFAALETRSVSHESISRSRSTIHRYQMAEYGGDDLPLLLAIDRVVRTPRQDWFVSDDSANDDRHADELESESLIDEPLVPALAVWQ